MGLLVGGLIYLLLVILVMGGIKPSFLELPLPTPSVSNTSTLPNGKANGFLTQKLIDSNGDKVHPEGPPRPLLRSQTDPSMSIGLELSKLSTAREKTTSRSNYNIECGKLGTIKETSIV